MENSIDIKFSKRQIDRKHNDHIYYNIFIDNELSNYKIERVGWSCYYFNNQHFTTLRDAKEQATKTLKTLAHYFNSLQ